MKQQDINPIPNSYWVRSGQLLAGEYPGTSYDETSRARLWCLLESGITFFLDLTEAGEYGTRSYAPLLQEEAAALGQSAEHWRMDIPDRGTPTPDKMAHILDTIDAALAAGQVIYAHCYAGVGRTGTVVGCYLVRHGLSGEAALEEIARLRAGIPISRMSSPETPAQRQMVRDWPIGG